MAYCELQGAVVDYNGQSVRAGKIFRIKKVEPSLSSLTVFDSAEQTYVLDANGIWNPLIQVEQGATAYVYMEAPNFDSDPIAGVPITIPNAATAVLSNLV